ncbi:hypothetical protein TI05_14110 [Achromatium sp. WMS3]|nr:hypothetical protein TI05_14110 [Achromatium sp. WMS3]
MEGQHAFTIELVKSDQVQSDIVSADGALGDDTGNVAGRDMIQAILDVFGESSPSLDFQPQTDEDCGWELEAQHTSGREEIIPDNTIINLRDYKKFKASPRTVVGYGKESIWAHY